MTDAGKQGTGRHSCSLPNILDLAGAEPLLLALREKLDQDKSLILDASQVERVSTACIQVLLAARHSAQARGQAFVLDEPSSVLVTALQDLGLAAAFNQGHAP